MHKEDAMAWKETDRRINRLRGTGWSWGQGWRQQLKNEAGWDKITWVFTNIFMYGDKILQIDGDFGYRQAS